MREAVNFRRYRARRCVEAPSGSGRQSPCASRMTSWAFVAVMGGWGAAGPAGALEIHYEPDRAEPLRECDAHAYVGRAREAEDCYRALTADDGSAAQRAAAFDALGEVGDANRFYREAAEASGSEGAAARTAWGRLYLRTHQVSDAEALFREALLHDPAYLPAEIALAEATAESYEGRARETLERIVAEHPDEPRALLLLARIELELQHVDAGRTLLRRALAATDARGLPPLEVFALQAGADLLEDRSMAPRVRAALALNPRYGDVYAIPAHFYIITYRYREAVELYRRAVDTDPTLASAHRDLGINLLRIDDLYGARHHLEAAYALDPYDAMTVNTLKLVDSLDGMRLSFVDVYAEDDSAKRPVKGPANDSANGPAKGRGRFLGRAIVRLDREDADALEPYVHELVERAMRTFSARYDFTLEQPVIVELYHDHDDFGVRTVSTPGIGLLGVTFGYLTAMDSPKARASGEFHWGSTLWHELAHVYTLEATEHRLPRWFSEGLSVFEEWHTGPLADRELPMDVLAAIRAGRLLPVTELDRGFVRPSYQGQVQVSYMQAGLTCDFIAGRWGQPALVRMLDAFSRRVSTAGAVRLATGLSTGDFDAAFEAWIRTRHDELLASLDDYGSAERQLGRALQLDDRVSVEALARDLVRRYPERVGRGNPYEPLAEAQRAQGRPQDAVATLLEWQSRGGHAPDTLVALVDELRGSGREDDAARIAEALNWVMPYDADAHRFLGDHYLAEGDPARALREYDALLGLRPEDPAAARYGMARAASAAGDPDVARREVLRSLEAAPFYRPAQRLLLELAGAAAPGSGAPDDAAVPAPR